MLRFYTNLVNDIEIIYCNYEKQEYENVSGNVHFDQCRGFQRFQIDLRVQIDDLTKKLHFCQLILDLFRTNFLNPNLLVSSTGLRRSYSAQQLKKN